MAEPNDRDPHAPPRDDRSPDRSPDRYDDRSDNRYDDRSDNRYDDRSDVRAAELVSAPPRALRGEPPVVARLVVEIRSDGSRTIARGAMEDVATGVSTTVEARGDSPLQLALALGRALTQLPRLGARQAIRGLLGKRRER